MEGRLGGEGDEGGGLEEEEREGKESAKEREGRQGVDLSRAWGQPTRQKGE